MIHRPWTIAPVFVLVGALRASIGAQEQTLATESFTESLRTNAPSGGEVFRGIHQAALDARPKLAALSVSLPAGNQSRLCVTLETQDGRYLGEASYLIGRRAAPLTRGLRLPTAHRSLLESLPVRDVSVIAFVAESCQSDERIYLPLSLGTARMPDGSIVVLVNSRTPGVTVRVFHEEANRYAACESDTMTERQVAFNVECRVVLPTGTHQATLTIVRNRAERVLAPESIVAYIP
jgi:hypothetical protein